VQNQTLADVHGHLMTAVMPGISTDDICYQHLTVILRVAVDNVMPGFLSRRCVIVGRVLQACECGTLRQPSISR